MKFIFSIAMLLLLVLQVSMKPLLMLEWKINQELITAWYCENKDNPMMHCDGKCYLSRQLQKLEIKEQEERSKHPFPAEKLKLAETVFICPQEMGQHISLAEHRESLQTSLESANHYWFDFQENIAHPPEV